MFNVQREKFTLTEASLTTLYENSYNSSVGCRKAKLHTAVSLLYIQLHMHRDLCGKDIYVIILIGICV